MKRSNLSRVAGTAIAALVAFAAIPAFATQDEVPPPPEASSWYAADGGYGSQGFHHGLPDTAKSDVFAVDMIPYGATPDTATMPQVEPVAGGAEAMRDASILADTPDAD